MGKFIEIRRYSLRRGPMQKRFDEFLALAMVPALNRLGLRPIGVFHVLIGPENPSAWLFIPHVDAESIHTLESRLEADAGFQTDGAAFLRAGPMDPPFIRSESTLLKAVAGIPQFARSSELGQRPSGVYELRTYESHSLAASQAKIRMFLERELDVFRRVGLRPVLFGETVFGTRMPSFSYLVPFENLAERERIWAGFLSDPEWKEISALPGWTDADLVTSVSSLLLRPSLCSQL